MVFALTITSKINSPFIALQNQWFAIEQPAFSPLAIVHAARF